MSARSWRRLIRGHWWTVRLVSRARIQAHPDAAGHDVDGLCVYVDREILICDDLRGKRLIDTIAHEWDHVEHPGHDHRKVNRRASQLADVIAAVVCHSHRTRTKRG